MSAEILSIGSELMAGRIADTNAAFLSEQLARLGFQVTRHTAVGDREGDILEALTQIADRADVAIVTGGLGPTPDDLTRQAFAEFCKVELVESTDAAARLRDFFTARNRVPSPSNFIQARIPRGGAVLINGHGTAAGFSIRRGKCDFFCLPGVPSEMKLMFQQAVAPALAGRTTQTCLTRCLHVFGIPESVIGERLRAWMGEDKDPEVATQASHGTITIRITSKAPDEREARERIASVESKVRAQLGPAIFGGDEQTLEGAVAALLKQRGLSVAVAESCTGGEVSARLTDIPGISRHLLEAAVTYSNEAKVRRLNVPVKLIERHGAVSLQVAEAMAAGMRAMSGADITLAVTGIAGPTGATAAKPVGLVYVALATAASIRVEELRLAGNRKQIKDRAAKHALNMLRLYLEEDAPNMVKKSESTGMT